MVPEEPWLFISHQNIIILKSLSALEMIPAKPRKTQRNHHSPGEKIAAKKWVVVSTVMIKQSFGNLGKRATPSESGAVSNILNTGHDCFQLCPVFFYLSIISFSRYGWITLPLVAFRVQWVSIVAVVSYCLGFDSLWMIFLAMKKVSIGSIQSIHCIGKNKSFAISLLIIGWNICNFLIEQNFYVSEHFTKWNFSEIKKKRTSLTGIKSPVNDVLNI